MNDSPKWDQPVYMRAARVTDMLSWGVAELQLAVKCSLSGVHRYIWDCKMIAKPLFRSVEFL